MGEHTLSFYLNHFLASLNTKKAICLIAVLGFVVFSNSLFNGFVWDDIGYIELNSQIHTFNLSYIFGPSQFNNGYYRALPALYFSVLYPVFHSTTFFYHLFQIILHILNTSLLFYLFKRFFNIKLSLFLSLIFLVHPIQVESVVFIEQSIIPLLSLFGTLAFLISLAQKLDVKKIFLMSACLLLSLLTKETAVIFIFITLLYSILFNRKNIFILFLSTTLTLVVYLFIRLVIGRVSLTGSVTPPDEIVAIAQLPLAVRLINVPAIIFYYIKTFLFPVNLAIDQQWVVTKVTFSDFYFPLIVELFFVILIILFVVRLWRVVDKTLLAFCFFLLWFLAGLLMHIQIVPLTMTVADRWFYIPIVGLLGLLGFGLQSLKFFDRKLLTVGYALGVGVLVALSIRTIIRNADWRNRITLYSHDVKISDNSGLQSNLGLEYFNLQENDKALIHFKRSVELSPSGPGLSNLGAIYDRLGDIEKAEEYYLKAINFRHPPDNGWPVAPDYVMKSYLGLTTMLLFSEKPEAARVIALRAVREAPNSANLWSILAAIEYKLGHTQEALVAAEKGKALAHKSYDYFYEQIINNQSVVLIKDDARYVIKR